MKIFSQNATDIPGWANPKSWRYKVNFVDANNVVVGYNLQQDCYEWASWFIADKVTLSIAGIEKTEVVDFDLDNWFFDSSFFIDDMKSKNSRDFDEGGMVIFRIYECFSRESKYLHLFNCHNGYYGHGFTIDIGGITVYEGVL